MDHGLLLLFVILTARSRPDSLPKLRDGQKKSRRLLRLPAELTFGFIADHLGEWPASWMCEALGVSESGFHARAAREPGPAQARRRQLLAAIEAIHDEVKGRYGSPRMAAELNARGHECSENAVAELMREKGIRARAPRRFVPVTTDSRHRLPVAENVLDRDFSPAGPNAAWSADITYVPTAEGWLYLAVVEDLFSRMVVGWSMGSTMTSRLVVDALEMAVRRRLPGEGLVAHSDRGSRYASDHDQGVLKARGMTCSMSGVAQCWDNAPVESFFASLKKELVHDEKYATREEAKASIFEYVEAFYDRVRLHSSLGYVSPAEYERAHDQTHR